MSQFRAAISTHNNPSDWKVVIQSYWDTGRFKCVCGQLEMGELGTPHLQAYVLGFNPLTLGGLKKLDPHAHWEQVKKDNGAADYCMKEDTRLEGPLLFGTKPMTQKESSVKANEKKAANNKAIIQKGALNFMNEGLIDLKDYEKIRKALFLVQLDSSTLRDSTDVKGVWIYGHPGVGKSHKAREDYPGAYLKPQNKWWDGYNGEKSVILDDFDKLGTCLGHYLKIWADKWGATGEIKGGTIILPFEHFVVTSNYSIQDLFADDLELQSAILRRFKVIHILDRMLH